MVMLLTVLMAVSCVDNTDTPADDDSDSGGIGEDKGEDEPDEKDELPKNPFENGYNPDGWV
jgi:hypothetical protein